METSQTTRSPRRRLGRAWAKAASAALALLWLSSAPHAGAVPASVEWTQYQGSATHSGSGADGPSPPFIQAWQALVPAGGPEHQWGLSAPVVSGNTIVAVGPEQVVGFHLEDGSAAFTVDRTLGPSVPPAVATVGKATALVYTQGFGTEPPSAVPTSPSASVAPASTSSTSPSGSAVPTVGASSKTSQLAAFNLETQKPLWPPVALDQASRTGVTVLDGVAYVGDDLGTVYAIDLAEGSIAWKRAVGGTPQAPVAVAGGLVFVTVPGSAQNHPAIVALKAGDGTPVWHDEGASLGTIISGAAVADTADAVYAVFPDDTLRAYDMDGALRWKTRLSAAVNPTGSPVVTDDAVYVVDLFGQASRFDPSTGHRVWDYATNEPVVRGAPVYAGGHILAATGRGRLAAIDPVSGHLVWQSDAPGSILRGLTPTSDLIVAVRGGAQAGLVAFRNDPNGVLVDVVSPTVFNAGMFAGNFAIAALAFVIVTVLAGRFLSNRMGPAFIVEDAEVAEPVDPWGEDEG